jgi:hypothetical protein
LNNILEELAEEMPEREEAETGKSQEKLTRRIGAALNSMD